LGLVPQVGVPKATERMVSSLMRFRVWIDVIQFLQCRVKMTTDDVRRRDGFSCPSAEKKTRTAVAHKLFNESGNRRVNVNLTKTVRRGQDALITGAMALVDLTAAEGKLMLHVRGADKLWAFKSSLEIPLVHVAGVRADPEVARGWYHGIRLPGTNVPGVITAATFYQDGKRVFWDVHHPEKTIVIDLHDERYNELIVEVDDPDAAVKLIQNAL